MKSLNFRIFQSVILLGLVLSLLSCNQPEPSQEAEETADSLVAYNAPAWSKDAIIYEVNIRQYTPEGTINAFQNHLPRLKNLGVDILWLMPIHPIGEKNRKGTLGSYYAVQDYTAVNPEFGTLDDFKELVQTAHDMGFYVILDWVANHTAWDNPWIDEHPEWYTTDSTGNIIYPADWTDVADLNYDNRALWEAMTDALKYWVVETGVDGYRCDVAASVPTEYWESARKELQKHKPVFMLAEAEEPEHHNLAFDMSYAWELHSIFNKIAKGSMNADSLDHYFSVSNKKFPEDAYRMNFITNHDENSWNGTIEERLGPAASVMAVLSYTLPGMPLIYSGQEVGLNKALEFFEKDEIDWNLDAPQMEFYTALNRLKKANPALWNGSYGGPMVRVGTNYPSEVFAFTRTLDDNTIFVLANLSDTDLEVVVADERCAGSYVEYFSGTSAEVDSSFNISLPSWDYRVYIKR